MPSKLRKAIGAVKDQTSISLAKVSNSNVTNLEVAILKATTHDEVPIDDRYVDEILHLISSDKAYAAACAQSIGKRISKTRNWIVALKSLMLVLKIFQDGDPYFPREVLHAMKRGSKILNLSTFRDDSNSNPWDYTAFIRTFALYLDERLDCFLTGKLQRRVSYQKKEIDHRQSRREPVSDMKPAMLLDKISYWQKLLERAVATRPTGSAKTNRLVQISLYAIVQESFDLYRDISDGLALLLDSFFHLQYQSCVVAFQACVRATKQFEELGSFYELCKSIGVGRTSEYPSVQQLSDELIETLREFLKDQASFPSQNGRSPTSHFLLPSPSPKDPGSSSEQIEPFEQPEPSDRFSDYNSRCTSLEDLMSGTEQDRYSDQSDKQSNLEDFASANDTESYQSLPTNNGSSFDLEFVSFVDWPQHVNENDLRQDDLETSGLDDGGRHGCLELVFFEPTTQPTLNSNNSVQPDFPTHQYNPFLQDGLEVNANDPSLFPANDMFVTFHAVAPDFGAFHSNELVTKPTFHTQNTYETKTVLPSFQAQATIAAKISKEAALMAPTFQTKESIEVTMAPTFRAINLNTTTTAVLEEEDDPFAPCHSMIPNHMSNGTTNEESFCRSKEYGWRTKTRS